MFLRLDTLTEAVLTGLERDGIPEGLQLEYKREIDLDREKQKLEAAKDISALANTQGGQILYGLDEKTLPDGRKVAGPPRPLTDGTIPDRLANVLAATIHPRVQLQMKQVDVSGGYVLVVEVSASQADLHMVTGYDDLRYYRRGPTGVVPMTEHEVRDAYARFLLAREKVEARERELSAQEFAQRSKTDESIVVTPLFAPDGLCDPRRLGDFADDIKAAFIGNGADWVQELTMAVKIDGQGFRAVLPYGKAPEDAHVFLAVRKWGAVHFSYNGAITNGDKTSEFFIWQALLRVLETLTLAKRIYLRTGYVGLARVRYELRMAQKATVVEPIPPGHIRFPGFEEIALSVGTHQAGPVDVLLATADLGPVAKEIVDPLFQAIGKKSSPWFDVDGRFVGKFPPLPPSFAEHVRIAKPAP